ncbi:hypothetical protein ACOKM3_37770 [Streptomyces sp. BH106]|uniref:hypothetical protein n=1 Tax=Streptomyces sp. BH106 TaxID=3410409 RepID=UPI003CF0FDB6
MRTGPAALNDGYALGLALAAAVLLLAAVVAIGVLPRRRVVVRPPQPTAPAQKLEGTPS